MRAVLGCALAVGLVAAASAAGADDKPEKIDAKKLVGKWEPADAPKGAKAVIEFTKDGKVKVEVEFGGQTQKFDGTYKLDGNKLSLTRKKGDKDDTDVMTVTKLTDDEMVMEEDGKKKSETLKRIKEKK
ncbi:MAG: TIGR03066 family protein [Gemmataceae bacterium]|nr:TIGR03066 family protein [Gemmataceae bacterium]